jgi:hypothetical protein
MDLTFEEWNADNRSIEMERMEQYIKDEKPNLKCCGCSNICNIEVASVIFVGIRTGHRMDVICQNCDKCFWTDHKNMNFDQYPISQYYTYTKIGRARFWRFWGWMWFKRLFIIGHYNPTEWLLDLWYSAYLINDLVMYHNARVSLMINVALL